MTKGISLPINAVIIIALAAVVLLVAGSFFMAGTGPSMSKIQARQVFEDKCPKLKCEYSMVNDFTEKNYPANEDFFKACKILYDVDITKSSERVKCLYYCECGLEVDTCGLNCKICGTDAACIALLKNKYPDCDCNRYTAAK